MDKKCYGYDSDRKTCKGYYYMAELADTADICLQNSNYCYTQTAFAGPSDAVVTGSTDLRSYNLVCRIDFHPFHAEETYQTSWAAFVV